MLDQVKRRAFEATLEHMRRQLLDEGDVPIEPNRGDVSTRTDEDAQPLNEMSQVMASARNQARAGSLGAIVDALARLREHPDEFGLCLECEEPIPLRRLELMPYAALCVECQAERDPARGSSRRSLTDFR